MTSTARSCPPRTLREKGPKPVRTVLALAALALGMVLLQPALAKQGDRQQPANIVAKSFDGSQQDHGYITYRGQVKITQGTLKVTGDLAKAYLDHGSNVTRIVLTGTPAHIQQLDDNGNLMQGEAATIDYDNVKGIAVLSGNAVVKQQGRGEAHGDKLTYDTATSQMTGESAGDGLVHMIFQPTHPPAAAPQAPGSPAPATSTRRP